MLQLQLFLNMLKLQKFLLNKLLPSKSRIKKNRMLGWKHRKVGNIAPRLETLQGQVVYNTELNQMSASNKEELHKVSNKLQQHSLLVSYILTPLRFVFWMVLEGRLLRYGTLRIERTAVHF